MPSKQKKRGEQTEKYKAHTSQKTLVLLLIVFVATAFSFFPSINNGFTNWDDPGYVTENHSIRALSFTNLKDIFTSYVEGNYHPLTMLSYSVEYYFAGLNPKVYHIDNLLLHLFNTMLVFWFIHLLTGKLEVATITSLFFGIHPLHVESVAWISERKDLLFSLFYLGALISYVFSLKNPRLKKRWIAVSMALFILSLLSKAMAVTLPLVFILIDYYFMGKFTFKIDVEKIPFLLLSLAFGVVSIIAQQAKGAVQEIALFPYYERILFASYAIVVYVWKLFVPFQLSSFYPYPINVDSHLPGFFYFAPVVVILIVMAVIRSLRSTKDIAFGTLFFLITMVLVLQLYPVGSAMMADRYAYLPYIGLFFIIGQGYKYLTNDRMSLPMHIKPFIMSLLVIYAFWMVYLTRERCEVWKDNMTLWTDVINKFPLVPVAYNNRALTYSDMGDYDLAMRDLNKALEIKPNDIDALNNRGNTYFRTGKYNLAVGDFNKALQVNPKSSTALNGRGAAYFNMGQFDSALDDFNNALEIKPEYIEAFLNRGNVLSVKRSFEAAIADYDIVLLHDPDNAKVYYWRGLAKHNLGNLEEAIVDYSNSLRITPTFAAAYYERSKSYYAKKQFNDALQDVVTAKSFGYQIDSSYMKSLKSSQR